MYKNNLKRIKTTIQNQGKNYMETVIIYYLVLSITKSAIKLLHLKLFSTLKWIKSEILEETN